MKSIEQLLLAETTVVDHKEDLEEKRPKSWLKNYLERTGNHIEPSDYIFLD